jgi:hypothetical protein
MLHVIAEVLIMTKETLDYKPLVSSESPQDTADENIRPEYSQLSETLSSMPVETDDEEALEQYMNSMLERLTGESKREPVATELLEPIDAVVEATPVVVEAPVREPVRPGDVMEDLSGMRELANQNVESALGVHSYGRLVQKTKSTLVAAVGFSFVSSLVVLLTHNSGSSWSYPAAITGTCAAFLASFRYFGLCRQLNKIHRQVNVGTE